MVEKELWWSFAWLKNKRKFQKLVIDLTRILNTQPALTEMRKTISSYCFYFSSMICSNASSAEIPREL